MSKPRHPGGIASTSLTAQIETTREPLTAVFANAFFRPATQSVPNWMAQRYHTQRVCCGGPQRVCCSVRSSRCDPCKSTTVSMRAKRIMRMFVGIAFPTICASCRSVIPALHAWARKVTGKPCKFNISSTQRNRRKSSRVRKYPPQAALVRVRHGTLSHIMFGAPRPEFASTAYIFC